MNTLFLSAQKQEDVEQAGEILRRGGLVAVPTETVYGLAANALDGEAVKKIFEAKGRPQDNPLIVHISSMEELEPLVETVPEKARLLAKHCWPGPLTMIFKKSDKIPREVSTGLDTVGIRMPCHPAALAVIRAAGVPLAAPSANTSGKPSPTTAQHVKEDMQGKIDAILDGGECAVGVESTVVDMVADPPRILRPGGITREQLQAVLGEVVVDQAVYSEPKPGEKVRAPGMKYRHYAPQAPVLLFGGAPEASAEAISHSLQPGDGVLCFEEYRGRFSNGRRTVLSYGLSWDKQAQAQELFSALRAFDHTPCKRILAQAPRPFGEGFAVSNRIKKAAGFHLQPSADYIVVGVTGSSGSGKSTVSALLRESGWASLDADLVYHQLLENDRSLINRLADAFPGCVQNGKVSREVLGEDVFGDEASLETLNALTHPSVMRELRRRIRVLAEMGCKKLVLDVPLLYQSGLDRLCDYVIGVTAEPERAIDRIISRDGVAVEKARRRLMNQPQEDYYAQRCEILLHNTGTKEELREKLAAAMRPDHAPAE